MGVFCCFSFDSGGFAQKFMLLVKKNAFLSTLLFISAGKTWNTSFLSEKLSVHVCPNSSGVSWEL